MSKCLYICPIAIYVSAVYKIYVQVDVWGSHFILPRFNVIFDMYFVDAVSTYISAGKLMQMS